MAQLENKEVVKTIERLQAWANSNDGDGAAVGAVVMSNGVKYEGFNQPGHNGFDELYTHAEVDALSAAENDVLNDIEGGSIITTRAPCLYCAAHIINARLSTVYMPPMREESKWYESQLNAVKAMQAVGIEVVTVTGLKGVRG